ncbi:MAG: hybrid sensor histidine kinase/response regulator [Polaromonas sp.]|jgi:signal transduction histidine kinase|nr:hybrid sensor histidine kinase/response regulator [Polaromonas sp.]MBP6156490.1 hybrid sensor histidine kinase/response regulator [Polaromonas sp.]MBP7115967.1 hybrid sensor histidine kinase/response regulator [Polaromonas sp.]MBP7308092.1 hybrid sensor histidine kinase/response regulator [Polaromonas sp.]MBP8872710.1 hybrid sensor histidine kinase/response regulator [Polaromonas sp.]
MSLPLSSASKSSPIKSDLMQDARVRAVIKENLYRGMLVRPIIVTATVIMFWYLLEVWPNNLRLMLALGIWGTNSILYLALHFYHRFQDMDKRQLPEASSMYLKLLVLNCWIDCAALGFVGLLITIERPDFESMVVIGLIMYMFSAFIKNISYATASRFLPALVFMPVTIAFLMRGDVAHIIIAVYFIISTFSLSVYGASAAAAIQLPIKQQYEIAKQNEALSQLTKQLSIERDRADAANAAKSHFFTAASHDARQPLQAISLLFDGFKMSSQTNLQDKKIIEKIEVNLNAIRHLFDRVLDISRIDSGHVTPEIKNFSLQKLFNKLDAQFGELAASKGLWLHFVPTAAWVEHDSELLDRIVSNLVHNAIKYTQTGGVWVAWRQARGRLEIRDSGIGISSGEQATIFNEFAQVNNPARNNDAGLGLGLSIVKRLAELTQTPFGLRSQKNMGSTFWLELNAKPLQNNLLNAQQTALNNFTKVPAAKMEKPLAGLTIFYVEDNSQLRNLFEQSLLNAGATVTACANLDEVNTLVAQDVHAKLQAINVILADYRLGASGTGLDAVQAVRDHTHKNIPAVLITGDSAVRDLQTIQQLPNSTLLHKPVEFHQLKQVLLRVT